MFGCVGVCGQGLSVFEGFTYCPHYANGPWESGDGTTCANAGSDVPSGQGDGKYGAIGSWIVSKITNMNRSECTTVHPRVVSSSCLLSRLHLSLSSISDRTHSPLLLLLLLLSRCPPSPSSVFYSANQFNGDLSAWDVGSVTNMENSECTTVHPCCVVSSSCLLSRLHLSLSFFHF